MILVRQVFQVPIGTARAVAASILQGAAAFAQTAGAEVHGRVLTDISGPFGTVILEIEVESLAAWERMQAARAAQAAGKPGGADGAPPFTGGYQEFYTLEGTF